jgi:hypothetical protein
MHELAVTESIVKIVAHHAEQADARRVLRIHLVVGELSSIVDDSVQFYFDYLSQGTLAEVRSWCSNDCRCPYNVARAAISGNRRQPIGPAPHAARPVRASWPGGNSTWIVSRWSKWRQSEFR